MITPAGRVAPARHEQKAGRVAVGVLDVARKDVEAVDLGREFAGQGSGVFFPAFRDFTRGAGVVGVHAPPDAVFGQEGRALRQKHQMGMRLGHVFKFCTRHTEEVDVHAHEGFIDDLQSAFRQKTVDIGNSTINSVFHRQHRQIRLARLHRRDHILKGAAGQWLHVGAFVAAGFVRIGAQFPLESDGIGHADSENLAHRAFGRGFYTLPC